MNPGDIIKLKIDEELDFGYFLTDGYERVLLHNSEITQPLEDEEEVEVFLMLDSQDRLSATMKKPLITEDGYGWTDVVSNVEKMGVFIDIGLSKDALVADDHLPLFESLWPQEGDKLYCTLRISKNGKLFARPATEDVMMEITKKADRSAFNKDVEGRVYRTTASGTYVITEEGYRAYIHESQREEEPRLGSRVHGRVVDVKEDGTINISLLPRKQDAMNVDAEKVYAYMQSRGGAMPFWDKSNPDDIKEVFGLSKAAFKRALGSLYKSKRVYQEEGWTYTGEKKGSKE
ncbi:hypothetical protein GJU40_15200 [Bacillus lacus]|uniref:S1 motif domain-containing protein n=1 Tax=Metabacillus lacus TaxID=1983721 RepID=A0A7X2M0Z3_9BACI|nr:S1-like domain-containing RNA-binding protein [Metabacillus lacus]MRX73489.1 hypothetical protein [Metabacillus lacus]